MSAQTYARHWSWTLTLPAKEYSQYGRSFLQLGKDSATVGYRVAGRRLYEGSWRIQDFQLLNNGTKVWIKGVVTTRLAVPKKVIVDHLQHAGASAKANVWATIYRPPTGRKNWRGYINSYKDF